MPDVKKIFIKVQDTLRGLFFIIFNNKAQTKDSQLSLFLGTETEKPRLQFKLKGRTQDENVVSRFFKTFFQ